MSDAVSCPACAATTSDPEPWPVSPPAQAYRCDACDLRFVAPPPSVDALAAYYAPGGAFETTRHPKRAARATTRTKAGAPAVFAAFDAYFPASRPPAGARVLDFGCGTGSWLNSFQDRGWITLGIEPSTDVAFVRHQRLTALPTVSSVDLVVAYHVLEHLPRPLETLRQFADALTAGGHCFISVPRVDTVDVHGDRKYCLDGTKHLVAFSEACLRGLLTRAGLTPVAAFHHLDDVFTPGRPLRLRMLARKG